jgi:small-conductance mechanosensitive channel
LVKSLLGLILGFALVAFPALAQPAGRAAPVTAIEIEKIQSRLDEIEKSLERPQLSDSALETLREAIDPIAVAAHKAIESLEPKLTAIKARIEQLGPKPDEKARDGEAPAETPDIANERADQQKSFSEVEGLLKRARLVAVRADQAESSITTRRRTLFTRSLFERVSSIASPDLWSDVWHEMPRHFRAVASLFGEWLDKVNTRLAPRELFLFWGSIALVLLGWTGVALVSRRVLSRSPMLTEPSRLLKCLGAWWVAVSIAVPAIAAIALIELDFSAFAVTDARMQPFMAAVAFGLVRIAVLTGIARGLLAPTRPNWRLLNRTDAEATRTFALAVTVVTLVSVTRVLEALNDIVGASLAFSVATRGVHAAVAAIVLFIGLWRLGGQAADDDASFGPPVTKERDWFGLYRLTAWPVTLAIIASIVIGYITFANFLIDQLVLVGMVLCVLYLSATLVDAAINAGITPKSAFGSRLRATLGLRQNGLELLGVVVSGVMRFTFYVFAALVVVAPWGLQSSVVSFDITAAFLGFKLGDITISPASVVIAIALFACAYGLVRAALGWLERSLLPRTGLDIGLRNAIRTSLGYLGFLSAVSLALGYLGVGMEKIAIVAGALSVGIGFGLQSIVNNFVSGLVLLWERAIRVGDWIVVGEDQGYVRRINVRSTEIETFDRVQVIIPNSNLVTGVVKNLVRIDRTGRLVIPITVAGTADPEIVREILLAAAKSNDLVLKFPSPQILFTAMSPIALSFDLMVYLSDVETILRARSDLHFEIFKRLKAAQLAPGPDATRIEIRGFDSSTALFHKGDGSVLHDPEGAAFVRRSDGAAALEPDGSGR